MQDGSEDDESWWKCLLGSSSKRIWYLLLYGLSILKSFAYFLANVQGTHWDIFISTCTYDTGYVYLYNILLSASCFMAMYIFGDSTSTVERLNTVPVYRYMYRKHAKYRNRLETCIRVTSHKIWDFTDSYLDKLLRYKENVKGKVVKKNRTVFKHNTTRRSYKLRFIPRFKRLMLGTALAWFCNDWAYFSCLMILSLAAYPSPSVVTWRL